MTAEVRRVREEEWRQVRDLRVQALHDPAAPIAFLDTVENASAQPDEFWQQRTSNAAVGDEAAQFVAIDDDGEWFGTVTVLHPLGVENGLVVGVYVAEGHRSTGIIDELFEAAAEWATTGGAAALTLEVHVDNARAQSAYTRNGFVFTGEKTTAEIGDEYVMIRTLDAASSVRRLLLVNGPNLNLLGTREPAVYGSATLADVEALTTEAAAALGYEVRVLQSNHEGVLIDAIHAAREDCVAVVVNPGGLTHTSVALRDALTGIGLPFAEVHISNVYAREKFRHFSYLDDVAAVRVVGKGIEGYAVAVRELAEIVDAASA